MQPLAAPNEVEAVTAEFQKYIYSVSHDLGSPARLMVEFSKLLMERHSDALNDEGKEYLSLIVSSGEKMQEMLGALLEYSRLNTMAKPHASVSSEKVMQQVLAVLDATGKLDTQKHDIAVAELPNVKADADQLMQLLMALIDNAVKFQVDGTPVKVVISAEQEGDMWRFSVKDNGIGIDSKFHPRIFEIFQRLHREEEYPGVGMGLTVAQKVVHLHGGEIGCKSEGDGQGTTFHFTLPAG